MDDIQASADFRRVIGRMLAGLHDRVLACMDSILISSEANARLREIFSEFGYPRRIVSDRGLAFISKLFKDFVADRGVRHVLNAIATPRANGQVERANRTIVQALATSAESEGRWDEAVYDVVWGLNNAVNAVRTSLPIS